MSKPIGISASSIANVTNSLVNSIGQGYAISVPKPKLSARRILPPIWIDKEEGFDMTVWDMMTNDPYVVVAKYTPRTTLGIAHSRIYLVDLNECEDAPVPFLKPLYKTLFERKGNLPNSSKYSITEDGVVTGAFGEPDEDTITSAILDMKHLYEDWRRFPKETDYSMVCKLSQALEDVNNMKVQNQTKNLTSSIEKWRQKIEAYHQKIADNEKRLNEIYERAADGMNLLEEHGIKVDIDGPVDGPNNLYSEDYSLYATIDPDDIADTVATTWSGSAFSNANFQNWAAEAGTGISVAS